MFNVIIMVQQHYATQTMHLMLVLNHPNDHAWLEVYNTSLAHPCGSYALQLAVIIIVEAGLSIGNYYYRVYFTIVYYINN